MTDQPVSKWVSSFPVAVLGITHVRITFVEASALYQHPGVAYAGIASGRLESCQYVGASIAAAVIELWLAGPASGVGLHRFVHRRRADQRRRRSWAR